MLDRTPRHKELHVGFKMLCEKLLTREGFLVMEAGWKQKSGRTPVANADLVIKRPSEPETTIVEAKFYRSRRVDSVLFRHALEELKKYRDAKKIKNALLIATIDVTAAMKAEAEKQAITVWGLADLIQLTAKTPTLGDTLSDLLRDGDPGSAIREQFADELAALDEQSPRLKSKGDGARLAGELDQVKPGREGARKFEQLCDKAIRYLFAEQFQRWTPQAYAEDGLHRPGLIARLVPRHEFWLSLSQDFRSRYILFSFDNDAEALPQGAILSGERYLAAGALRSVLVVVARVGIDAGARRACQAALREHGRLIICVTLAELKDMLVAKDVGDEFHDVLIERTADVLTDLNP